MAPLDVAEQSEENITIFIEDKLQNMAPIYQECSIHRVPKGLLDMKEKAYIPQVISIGPFHHNPQKFMATEELKLRFFNSYRCRVEGIISVQGIVEKVQNWEEKARRYYSEPINMDSEEFVKMMVLDGCFIVEFMIMDCIDLFPENKNKVHESIYKAIKINMVIELFMLENQLPYFVLQGLFDLVCATSSNTPPTFKQIVHYFVTCWVMPEWIDGSVSSNMLKNQRPHHLLDFLSSYFVHKKDKAADQKSYHPPSATQLSEAGVVFKKAKEDETTRIMELSFKNGILKIPPLQIYDSFETFARNLLAFAQFSTCDKENDHQYIIHYFRFLDELISTEKDVNLLVKEGIIINHIGGNDKEISQLFNDICKNITVYGSNYFSDINKDLQQHCERRRHRWMASLRHNYFNTPWALISFLAATFLILFTILQTIFTGISTFK